MTNRGVLYQSGLDLGALLGSPCFKATRDHECLCRPHVTGSEDHLRLGLCPLGVSPQQVCQTARELHCSAERLKARGERETEDEMVGWHH